jgi:hypothetical protein
VERFVPRTRQQIEPLLPEHNDQPFQGWETGGTPMN